MNQFQAEHWEKRYKYITQCSKDHPFIRKLKGGQEKFEDPEELLKFLKYSKEAAYMWTDSEDLAIICDMYQVRIKVITMKGVTDKSPTVNLIYPDAKMSLLN